MRMVNFGLAKSIAVIGAFITTSLLSQTIHFQSTNGPFGGRATGFGRSANGTLFAGIYYDKIYRSIDQGLTWEPLDFPNTESNQSVQFAWDDKGTVLAYWGRGLYVSKDNGLTWHERPEPPGYLFGIAKNGHFYSNGRSSGLQRSTDEGLTWAEYGSGVGALAFLACDAGMYIGTDKGLYFIPAFDKPRWLSPQISPITSLAQGNGFIYATTREKGLFRRAINDTSWQSIYTGGKYFWNVSVNESGTIFLLFQDENDDLFTRSKDQGLTWETILPDLDRYYFKLYTSGKVLLMQKDYSGHFLLSFDEGLTWTVPASGINSSWIAPHSLKQNSQGHLFAITGKGDVYALRKKEDGWQHLFISPLMTGIYCLMIDAADNIWIGADNGLVFISSDGGQSWYPRNIFPNNPSVLQMSSNGQGLMAASLAGGSIWISIDDGLNWRKTDLRLYATVITFSKRGDILVGTNSGLYKSKDQGYTWALVQGGLDFPGPADPQPVDVRDLACLPGGEIIASVEKEGGENPRVVSHIFRSTDDGETWENVVENGSGQIGYNKKGQVILSGGWYSFDSGQTWTALYFADHSSKPTTAVFMDEGGYCHLGTEGAGVWKSADAFSEFQRISSGGIGTEIAQAYGASWADYDNDGYDDFFLACAGPNRLYHNNGDRTFTQITAGAIVTDNEPSRGATWGDYDNDGFVDVFVANENAANSLYHNNGDGTFTKITGQSLTNEVFASRAAAWADYDRDGFLDLFVAVLNGNNLLYKNNGNGTFTRITKGAIVSDGGSSYGCAWADCDRDGDDDLFVANYGNNFLYRNNGEGSFTKITDGPIVTDGGNSFGGSWGDYDNDGYPDLFVTNTEGANYLYQNERDGMFSKIMYMSFVIETGVSKGGAWGDVNNDGLIDIYVAKNGGDALSLNQRNGNIAKLKTSYFSLSNNSLACAWSDANRDGFLDLLVANYDATTDLYFNYFFNAGSNSQWTEVKCVGNISNRSAIGALVQVKATIQGQNVWQTREISSQSGHSGQNSLVAHFGLGDADIIDSLRVVWPSGRVQVLTALMTNEQITVIEPSFTIVEFTSFSAEIVENEIVLSWKTDRDRDHYSFEIERKSGKEDWIKIGFVSSKRPATETGEYDFKDETLVEAGIYDYRLKIISTDGHYEYSSIVQVHYGLPMTFELKQNFPNPFNPSTLIHYALPREESVRLDVYDLLGRYVTTLVDKRQKAGYHEAVFQPIGLASGVYFYQLQAGAFFAKRKMLFIQ